MHYVVIIILQHGRNIFDQKLQSKLVVRRLADQYWWVYEATDLLLGCEAMEF